MREKEFLPIVRDVLGIPELNPMQKKMMEQSSQTRDIILLSPTGSGKTLAFILPVLKMLKPASGRVQVIVVAPSRELVIQISRVMNLVASGYKVTPLYGGHKVEDEVNSLSAGADMVVATPGRLLDQIRRRNIDVLPARILVLDEFDKSLELGFEEEMKKIVTRLKNVSRIILTSATRSKEIPDFLELNNPVTLDYLADNETLKERLRVYRVDSDSNDKLRTLLTLLHHLAAENDGYERSIVFVNHRESAERIAGFLKRNDVPCILYHGALDQRAREMAVSMFNNGSRPVLIATDLASRGLDIENVKSVIHYHQPLTVEIYTHRNGRTARVDNEGDVYVLVGPDEELKEYVKCDSTFKPGRKSFLGKGAHFETIAFTAGKKEKLSKGDILGFFVKEAGASPADIGRIDVYDHYSLAAVRAEKAKEIISETKNKKIKGEKRKLYIPGE
ncbi:MAG: DEAD/DEAH box helicase [Candidatus Amulumruptor caecigallinarius]|nr:DEAD/DEAH box helicase [Candidatus Amulumruptor caecigallinarius]